jgi:hypothetical protein
MTMRNGHARSTYIYRHIASGWRIRDRELPPRSAMAARCRSLNLPSGEAGRHDRGAMSVDHGSGDRQAQPDAFPPSGPVLASLKGLEERRNAHIGNEGTAVGEVEKGTTVAGTGAESNPSSIDIVHARDIHASVRAAEAEHFPIPSRTRVNVTNRQPEVMDAPDHGLLTVSLPRAASRRQVLPIPGAGQARLGAVIGHQPDHLIRPGWRPARIRAAGHAAGAVCRRTAGD